VKYFLVKLIPPRPTFHLDMSADERLVMDKHSVYWKDMQEKGIACIYGPVFDPKGVWGMGIMKTENEEEARKYVSDDPSLKAHVNTFEIIPMNAFIKEHPLEL
jgi:uncharacterized protein YciI